MITMVAEQNDLEGLSKARKERGLALLKNRVPQAVNTTTILYLLRMALRNAK
jgi:uncharacterized protein YjiK